MELADSRMLSQILHTPVDKADPWIEVIIPSWELEGEMSKNRGIFGSKSHLPKHSECTGAADVVPRNVRVLPRASQSLQRSGKSKMLGEKSVMGDNGTKISKED